MEICSLIINSFLDKWRLIKYLYYFIMSCYTDGEMHFRRIQKGLQFQLKMIIPNNFVTDSLKIQRREENMEREVKSDEQMRAARKLKVQMLLSKKSFKHQQKQPAFHQEVRQKKSQVIMIKQEVVPGVRASSREAEERERTRQKKPSKKSQPSPQPKPKLNLVHHIELNTNKIQFQSKFNQQDGIYGVALNTYYIVNSTNPGFMIVNNYPCQNRTYHLKFSVRLYQEIDDSSDCGIGITFKPVDLYKMKTKNNPVKRCMIYYVGSQRLSIGGSTYKKSHKFQEKKVYLLLFDAIKKKLMVCSESEMIVNEKLPQQFTNNELYFFLELKNRARITLL